MKKIRSLLRRKLPFKTMTVNIQYSDFPILAGYSALLLTASGTVALFVAGLPIIAAGLIALTSLLATALWGKLYMLSGQIHGLWVSFQNKIIEFENLSSVSSLKNEPTLVKLHSELKKVLDESFDEILRISALDYKTHDDKLVQSEISILKEKLSPIFDSALTELRDIRKLLDERNSRNEKVEDLVSDLSTLKKALRDSRDEPFLKTKPQSDFSIKS